MIKKDFLFFLISSLGFGLSAQILESRPEFTNAEQVAKVFNPSWYDEDAREKVKLDFLYKNRLGNFSEIRSFYTSLNLKVAKKSHLFFEGLSDQLGPYFQKNRLYAGYQLPIVINHNWTSS